MKTSATSIGFFGELIKILRVVTFRFVSMIDITKMMNMNGYLI